MRSYLSKYQPQEHGTDAEIERLAKQVWRKGDWLVLRMDKITDDWERQIVKNIGNRQYGRAP